MAISAWVLIPRKRNRWVFYAEYLQKQFEYRDVYLPVAQITAEGSGITKSLSDGKDFVLLIARHKSWIWNPELGNPLFMRWKSLKD